MSQNTAVLIWDIVAWHEDFGERKECKGLGVDNCVRKVNVGSTHIERADRLLSQRNYLFRLLLARGLPQVEGTAVQGSWKKGSNHVANERIGTTYKNKTKRQSIVSDREQGTPIEYGETMETCKSVLHKISEHDCKATHRAERKEEKWGRQLWKYWWAWDALNANLPKRNHLKDWAHYEALNWNLWGIVKVERKIG